ncbi:MAG: saccharopine dehydrogenase family protein [Candidatus Bathyarchaeia archaeon]
MKALVIGCGNIGSVAAEDLANSQEAIEVTVADNSEARAKAVADKIGKHKASWLQLDVLNRGKLLDILGKFDVVAGFLPGALGYGLVEACIKAGKDLVDVSFMAENPLMLDDEATKANVTVVPDCGLAPGISNLLVGRAVALLDKVEKVHVMVGGLPDVNVPPLGYVVTWSPESLVDEYVRKARIVRDGRIVEVEALSGVEEADFPKVGRLEAFYTDGLRTLIHTVGGVEEMWEKTLRYPGHAEKIKLLKSLGFFEDKEVDVEGTLVSPRKLTAKLLGAKLWSPEARDLVVLKVEVIGFKGGRKTGFVYNLLDFYDRRNGVTAMARTTAYPASIATQLLAKKVLNLKGVVPLEKIGVDEVLFETFMRELGKRGVSVTEEKVAF